MVHILQNHLIFKRVEIVSEPPNYLDGLAEKSGQGLAHSLCDACSLALYMSTMYMGTYFCG